MLCIFYLQRIASLQHTLSLHKVCNVIGRIAWPKLAKNSLTKTLQTRLSLVLVIKSQAIALHEAVSPAPIRRGSHSKYICFHVRYMN